MDAVTSLKIVVERHDDGYIAYPLDIEGAVIGEGETLEEAIADVRSAIAQHIEVFGEEVLRTGSPVLEASVHEVSLAS